MYRRARARVDQVQGEVAIGNRVDAVIGQALESELPATHIALQWES